MPLSWINRMFKKESWPVSRSGRKQYRRPSPTRPRVEALEDRQVPTVSFFRGQPAAPGPGPGGSTWVTSSRPPRRTRKRRRSTPS